MSLNHSVIGVDDDIFHTGIFLTYFSSHFYVHFGHGHAPGSVSVRPEKFKFLEKWQNSNFDYKIINFG